MKKTKTTNKEGPPSWDRLRLEAAKVRAIAHLIEMQESPDATLLDQTEINLGVAEILTSCARSVAQISRQMENHEITNHKRNR